MASSAKMLYSLPAVGQKSLTVTVSKVDGGMEPRNHLRGRL